MTRLFFNAALLAEGWSENVRITVDGTGRISELRCGVPPDGAHFHGSVAVPGMANIHSHAFQRAMAGFAERRGSEDDSFWTWRQAMYRFLEKLNPDDLRAIAGQLYAEMLEAGFTSVVEFHYLHHDPTGAPYADIGAMSGAIAEAASDTGIGLTLLPVFYAYGGFGGQPAKDGQRRFVNTTDRYAELLDRVREIAAGVPDAQVGVAPHSLRAVTPRDLELVTGLSPHSPIHIHIAEQTKEVDDCVAWSGKRPVEWLMDNVPVDRRWCLVHATHLTDRERAELARSGAVVGVCPITEANLGDGVFDGMAYVGDGGALGIGSDSNVYVSVAEELRLLEYTQRLRDRRRNRLAPCGGSVGRSLYARALAGGAQAAGRRVGCIAEGYRGDIVHLDADHPALVQRHGDHWLDGWLFAGDNQVVADVWVGGRQVVHGGCHIARRDLRRRFGDTLRRILED